MGDDLIHGKNSTGQRFASIPAFTSAVPGETGGMLRRQCTAEYKINVVERVIRRQVVGLQPRQRLPRGVRVVQYFGLSYDEPRRVSKLKSRFACHPWGEGRFPLFDPEMTRSDCVVYLKEQAIPHEIPRSAYIFYPFRRNSEWRHLPDLDQSMYLHRSCLPLAEADLDGGTVPVGSRTPIARDVRPLRFGLATGRAHEVIRNNF